MFWKSVTLDNYLPFTHYGNKHVEISFESPTTAILGGNGSGKSSLLRALTPYPAVRTSYGPKGKIVKVLSHNGSLFELTSDFSNTAAPHSFKKDGTELNVGGTTETQRDLIEENFGITKLIDDIMTGDIKICSMSKAERRALFSSTYPGDLAFVIEYHKKVCSQIRACNNQLKLLRSREASIRSSLISEDERKRLSDYKTDAGELIDKLSVCQLLLKEECGRYSKMLEKYSDVSERYKGWENQDLVDEVVLTGMDVRSGFRKHNLRRLLKDDFTSSDVGALAIRHNMIVSNAVDHLKAASLQIESVRDELNKLIACREANDAIAEKNQLEERYRVCQTELDGILVKMDPSAHVLSVEESRIADIENCLIPFVKNWEENLHATGTKIMSTEEFTGLGVQLEHARQAVINELTSSLSAVVTELNQVKDRLDKLSSKSYPKDCTQICPLRSAVSENVAANEKRWTELIEHRKSLEQQKASLEEFILKNGPIYEEQRNLQASVGNLVGEVMKYNLSAEAFEGENPIDCCNDHCSEIANRLIKVCTNTRYWLRKQAIEVEMESIRKTLAQLSNTKQLKMSEEIIESTIKDREEKLNVGVQELIQYEGLVDKHKAISKDIETTATSMGHLEKMVDVTSSILNAQRIEMYLEFAEGLIQEISKRKNEILNDLYSVDKTLTDQQKHLDILNSEILPTIEKVEHDKQNFEMVADGLSPASGLPCVYLIRYINRLLSRANQLIKDVWYYDMEMVYLKEDEDLDFSIKMMFRNSTAVNDISECSKGQQAIIDIAMTLAICIERGFLNWLPIKLDECDGGLTDEHRTRLACLLGDLIDKEVVKQMFLVNHFAMQTGLVRCDNVVLSPEGIVVPENANEHAIIS